VGSSLAKHLSSRFDVRVLDLRAPDDLNTDFRKCDVREKDALVKNLAGCDLVVNTAIIQVPEINSKKRLGYEVNVLGLQNICEAVASISSIKGLIHTGSWHVFGERDFYGVLDEQFGFRPDKIEDRAKFYALCKIIQESIVRVFAKTSSKSYSVIRLGTVLGEGMPKQTAANLFIDSALRGEAITPYKHTQHRPMLYVDIQDVCSAFESLASKTLEGKMQQETPALVNLVSPFPVTVLELARIIRKKVIEITDGRMRSKIRVIDRGIKPVYRPRDKKSLRVDVSKARQLLEPRELTHPEQTIARIVIDRARALKRETISDSDEKSKVVD